MRTLFLSLAITMSTTAAAQGHSYLKSTFGWANAAKAAASAGVSQLRHAPPEWGEGAAGYGKRLGSALGKGVINNTIHFAVSSLRHEEMSYQPSGKTGFAPRMKYALESTVVTHKTTTGERTVAAGEISGAVGSGLISRVWMPTSAGSIGAGFVSGGATLGADAASHVVKEFWPEIRHPGRRHSSH